MEAADRRRLLQKLAVVCAKSVLLHEGPLDSRGSAQSLHPFSSSRLQKSWGHVDMALHNQAGGCPRVWCCTKVVATDAADGEQQLPHPRGDSEQDESEQVIIFL